MLKITVPGIELFNDETLTFSTSPEYTLEFEHSLVAISKWESIWEKPLLGPGQLSNEETVDYVRAMLLTPDVPPEVFSRLTQEDYTEINRYIEAKMTATWGLDMPDDRRGRSPEIVTSELIYYWMLSLNIPKDCENWHLARLITLIQVTNKKNTPPKKTNPKTLAEQRRALNEQRRQQAQTKG